MSSTPELTRDDLLHGGSIAISVVASLGDIGREKWNELWRRSEAPTVFARYEWAAAWWNAFGGESRLRVYCAWAGPRLVGILPTVWPENDAQPVHLLCDDHADYAAVLTEPSMPGMFMTLVQAACSDLPRSGQLRLSELRSDTSYPGCIEQLIRQGDPRWLSAECTSCPRTDLAPAQLQAVLRKESLRRHTRKLGKLGKVVVNHHTAASDVLPRLDAFFTQHVQRWRNTGFPSLFNSEANRVLYRELASRLSETGLLLFTEITLDGVPVAFHFGFLSENDLVWYKPTFDPVLAKASPGEVLMRELFVFAGEQDLAGFDFTRGADAFKYRFSNSERNTSTFLFFASRNAARSARTLRSLRHHARTYLPGPIKTALSRLLRTIRKPGGC